MPKKSFYKLNEQKKVKGESFLLNPRIAATMAIFKAGGMNLPYLRIKQLLKEDLPECKIKYGVRMVRRYTDMFTENV